ncbi:MAG: quinone-dependent dihydroorotate dehydrogenase [Candidatus Omnitrophota bacterium]|jgi:dihydroorotate dehydrogenase|nr:MAG: quinone-dependent dihydroorotate dehydrogenase [Candidatus Omnitrophota bacterium]
MSFVDFCYQYIAKPVFFRFDPETIHEFALLSLRRAHLLNPIFQSLFTWSDSRWSQEIWGYTFPNPIGLAGGFDKNAVCVDLWDRLGFSFVEIGTVTPRPQSGNPKPRLFRYPARQAIVNRMGFNNDGAPTIAARLNEVQTRRNVILGISLGKQKETPIDDINAVIDDYVASMEILYPHGDFFTVNVSSPNTENLRMLQHGALLRSLLSALREKISLLCKNSSESRPKPLCVKFAPDLTDEELHAAIGIAMNVGVDGVIATNTTIRTGEREQGGLSGKPLRERSTEVVRIIANLTQGSIPIIGCGGIFTAEDAIEKLEAGASLLQIYTGFVYEGPGIVKNILRGLSRHLDDLQFDHIRRLHPIINDTP